MGGKHLLLAMLFGTMPIVSSTSGKEYASMTKVNFMFHQSTKQPSGARLKLGTDANLQQQHVPVF